MIPDKCKDWKVAKAPLLNYWCKCICGNTGGKLCEPWCPDCGKARLMDAFGRNRVAS